MLPDRNSRITKIFLFSLLFYLTKVQLALWARHLAAFYLYFYTPPVSASIHLLYIFVGAYPTLYSHSIIFYPELLFGLLKCGSSEKRHLRPPLTYVFFVALCTLRILLFFTSSTHPDRSPLRYLVGSLRQAFKDTLWHSFTALFLACTC